MTTKKRASGRRERDIVNTRADVSAESGSGVIEATGRGVRWPTTERVVSISVLDIGVQWRDGFENDPDLCFLLDRGPVWTVYDKRPCDKEQLSAQQALVVGSRARSTRKGWHLYWTADGDFASFFTWGGKPDDGFGGRRRTITLLDGSTEEIVGGWHVGASAAVEVGHPPIVECAYRTNRPARGSLGGGIVCFVTEDRFRREVAEHLPACEVVQARYGLTVKWRGGPSKAEFMLAERDRREAIRDQLKAKYHDGSWHGGDWYRKATDDERASLSCRPYSALGAVLAP